MTPGKQSYIKYTYYIKIWYSSIFIDVWKSRLTYSGFFVKHSTEDAVRQTDGLWRPVQERNLTLWECFFCKYFISVVFLFRLCCLGFPGEDECLFCFFFSDSLFNGSLFSPTSSLSNVASADFTSLLSAFRQSDFSALSGLDLLLSNSL